MELVKTSLLTTGANSKSEIEILADHIITSVEEKGGVFELAETMSATEHLIKQIKANDRYADYMQEQLTLFNGKRQTESGTKIEKFETSVSYDYSQNPNWIELSTQEKEIAEKRKALEERLRTIPAGKMLVDEETGETLTGPAKASKTSYKVTLAK